uniref:Uncharacterized protein n=1 Tax=Avena sativa TaxID=4498 RepID=A0ACD5XDH6_AVESA
MEPNISELLEGSMKPTNPPLEILGKIIDKFSSDRVIGEGGFGTVYKSVFGNWSVALKRIKSSMKIHQKIFRREVDSLMEVNHPNVVQFLGLCSHAVETPMKNPESKRYVFPEIREILLCSEYISNGSLDTKITDEFRGLDWDKRYQIIQMDIKPANILLDNKMMPKITDFGLSRPTENSQTMSRNHFS